MGVFLVRVLLFTLVVVSLASLGCFVFDWQWWVICLSWVAIEIVGSKNR